MFISSSFSSSWFRFEETSNFLHKKSRIYSNLASTEKNSVQVFSKIFKGDTPGPPQLALGASRLGLRALFHAQRLYCQHSQQQITLKILRNCLRAYMEGTERLKAPLFEPKVNVKRVHIHTLNRSGLQLITVPCLRRLQRSDISDLYYQHGTFSSTRHQLANTTMSGLALKVNCSDTSNSITIS